MAVKRTYGAEVPSYGGLDSPFFRGKGPHGDTELSEEDRLTTLKRIMANLKSRHWNNVTGQTTTLFAIVEELIKSEESRLEEMGELVIPEGFVSR